VKTKLFAVLETVVDSTVTNLYDTPSNCEDENAYPLGRVNEPGVEFVV
jgi:hypothetical protein